MANLFFNLPVPAAVGVGASVDVSTLGGRRTVTLGGTGWTSIVLEGSNDDAEWAPFYTFGEGGGKVTLNMATGYMRVRVVAAPFAVAGNCDVASDDAATVLATVVAPAGDGVGAQVDISALPAFKTVVVGGVYSGSLRLQVSDDGIDWFDCFSFGDVGGAASKAFTAQFMRAVRQNITAGMAGLPLISIGGSTLGGAAGGGGGGLPPLSGIQFSALIENPGGVLVFQRLTEDMILPGFVVTLTLDGTNTFEVGNDIVDPTFTVAYTNGTPAAATIDDGVIFVPLVFPYTAGQIIATYSSDPGAAANGQTQVFNCDATSTEGAAKSDTDTATWLPRVFWAGVADPGGGGYNEAFIETMAGNALASSRNRTIAYNTGALEYMFYCFPTDYGGGTPTFKDQSTGFDAGFSQVATGVSVTNPFGNTQDYEIWRSDNPNLGVVNIVVT